MRISTMHRLLTLAACRRIFCHYRLPSAASYQQNDCMLKKFHESNAYEKSHFYKNSDGCGSHSYAYDTICSGYGKNWWSNTLLVKRYLNTSSSSPDSKSEFSRLSPATAKNVDGNIDVKRLQRVQELMQLQIPVVLSQRHEYRIYTADVIFENNWNASKPRKTVGIGSYVLAVVKARMYIHSNYAKVKITVLSSEINEVSGTVQVNWSISYLPQAKAFMFWKYKPFQFRSTANQLSESVEGESIFFVNSKGFIYKHVLNKKELPTDADKSLSKEVQS